MRVAGSSCEDRLASPRDVPPPGAVAEGQALLQARGLAYGYGGAARLLEEVSLDVREREIVALLGGSGCGKSSLLRLLARLAEPQEGEVRFLGQVLTAPHPEAALLFQQPGLLPWLDVRRNVGFGLDFERQPRVARELRHQRVQAALDAVGLGDQGGLLPSQLSGGMAQRVALARALARQPRLLLADEPFSALDAITRAQMQSLLVELVHRWGAAALLVTHDIDEAILVADRVLLMGRHGGSHEPGQGPRALDRGGPVQPARLLRAWTIDIPRPRMAHAAEVLALRFEMLQALQDQHVTL